MIKRVFKIWPVLIFLFYFGLVYRQFIFKGQLPIPSDTIVGLYYPWRDSMLNQYPNGAPFKNSLITDAVRQEYPWRQLAIEQISQGKWPSWNPYSFSGYPLAANLQSAPFYPLNMIYIINDFPLGWSLQVILQPLLGGLFMAVFLRNLKLSKESVLMGTIAWVGCGFFIAWLETNMVVQSVIWLPLILFAIDKFASEKKVWPILLMTTGLTSSFLAGHLQSTFYVFITSGIYCLYRSWENRSLKPIIFTGISFLLMLLISLPVLVPAIQFISLSGRGLDQIVWNKPDWFLPWQNLVQLIAPDYFGNPATLNYFGIWNYAEFVGYVGLASLIFAISAILSLKRESRIFLIILIFALVLILPTPIAKLPFQYVWPLISSSQPSRLIVIVSFCLSVLAAFGVNRFQNQKKMKSMVISIGIISLTLITIWLIAWQKHWSVSIRNLVLPTGEFFLIVGALLSTFIFPKAKKAAIIGILLILTFDSSHFATKFLPFTPREWLYPTTNIMSFLTDQLKTDTFRVTAMVDTQMPDNFSVPYKIQTPSGYDPLYLMRYAEFIAALDRKTADITPPFNFNRDIRARSIDSKLYPLLNVKYILSPFELFTPLTKKIMQEGNTRLYELTNFQPRVFFVEKTISVSDKNNTISAMFSTDFNPAKMAIVETNFARNDWSIGDAKIITYQPNEVIIETNNPKDGFLVLTDSYYPSWHAAINNRDQSIFITDHAFRGIIVPAGRQTVRFWTTTF